MDNHSPRADASVEGDIKKGVGVLVIKGNTILCGMRTDDGKICGPGGHMKEGETPEEAAIRETVEEFGITPVELIPLAELIGMPEQFADSHLFICTSYKGRVACESNEMSHPAFLTLDQLDELTKDLYIPFLGSIGSLCKLVVFGGSDTLTSGEKTDSMKMDAGFNPSAHPRDKYGRFTSGAGVTGSAAVSAGKATKGKGEESPDSSKAGAKSSGGGSGGSLGRSSTGGTMTAEERASYKGPRGVKDPKIKAACDRSSTNTSERTGEDSLSKHCDTSGKLSPEREKLHRKIVEEQLAHAIPEEHPTFLMMGGGPAAGKGTIQRSEVFQSKYGKKDDRVTIDSDEIKKSLPEYKKMTDARDHGAAFYAHEESSAICKRVTGILNETSCSYTLDGTGDGSVKSLTKKINDARNAGMKVNGVYVTCDTDTAVKRAHKRGEETGRFVPEKVVRTTHKKVSQILPECAPMFDNGELYDTSSNPPTLIATFGAGKGLTATPGNDALLAKFLAKGNEIF